MTLDGISMFSPKTTLHNLGKVKLYQFFTFSDTE